MFQDPQEGEKEVRPRLESREGDYGAQRHEDRPTDEANSGNANSGIANHEPGTPSWGQKLLEYQLRSEKCLEELEIFVKNRGQSKDKVVLEEVPAKPAHVFTKKSYQIRSEFNNSVLKKLKDALEADTSEDRSSLLEEGIELIKQRNKLLLISDKFGWQTRVAYMLDTIAEDSDDERRIKRAQKEAKLLKEEKKKQLKSERTSVKKVPFLGDRNPSLPSMLNDSAKGVCRRCGQPGHYARACRAAIPPYRPGSPLASQQQSKDKVVLEEVPAKPAHVFTKKSYQIRSEFNNSVLKKLKDALEADTSEDRSSLLEEGIELIKQRNKLLLISDKFGWQTRVAYMLDTIAEDSDDERRIKRAQKEAKLLKEEKKKQLKSERTSVKKVPFLGDRNPSLPSMLNDSAKGVCRRCGQPGHYARACRAAIPPYRPGSPLASQQQSKDKVVLEEVPAKPAHVFTKKSYQIRSEFNNSVLKKLKDALEADTSEDRSSLLEEGIELIKQRNKLLLISDKFGWQTRVAYMLDTIAEDSDDERRIKRAQKEAKLLKEEKKKQLKSERTSVKKVPFLGDRNPSLPSMLNDSAKGVCRRCGQPGHYARACRAAIPPYRPGSPLASQQQPGFP